MQLTCARCSRVLEFSGERPSFCAYCGSPIPARDGSTPARSETPAYLSDGTATAVVTADAAPETVGGYRLLRALGTGGMGTVYEAEEISTGRRVALKLLAPKAAASSESLERFRQEGRLASRISHPHCVFVLAADEDAGRPYIVMELMPGTTLKELVEQRGPLPPEQAVAMILDVIEGLQQAHQHGVIHRDVKPSNCFVLPDGRVKIGDFGLAKSLVSDAHLTHSGQFLGTPLFASPEQIKGDPIDARTDVYSVAATLYFLLTGQAPFQRGTTTAALARIVSEPPPALRSLRPEVPHALDGVVLRGLERRPERRWRDLERFRRALLRFIPGHLSIGGMGIRLGAYLIDCAVFLPLWVLTGSLLTLFSGPDGPTISARLVKYLVDTIPFILYFLLLEGLWSSSLGKRLLGLRVCGMQGEEAPGLWCAFVRTFTFYVVVNGLSEILEHGWVDKEELTRWDVLALAAQGAGVFLLMCTMRASNGYRGVHEFLSGTRVVTLPPPERPRPLVPRQAHGWRPISFSRAAIGSYQIRGVLWSRGAEQVLLGADPGLGRDVWIWLRPRSAPPVPQSRRELTRPTRLRWLTCGVQQDQQWDAFVAPGGVPLAELVTPEEQLAWRETRFLLQQLVEELLAGERDGTLPAALTIEQVWVQVNGQLQLLDFPLVGAASLPGVTRNGSKGQPLELLGQVAVLALEGRPRAPESPPQPVQAPLPGYANGILRRLLGVKEPYTRVDDLQGDLIATRSLPAEVTTEMRAAHLGVLSTFLLFGLISMLLPTRVYEVAGVRTLSEQIVQVNRALAEPDANLQRLLAEIDPEAAAKPNAVTQLRNDLQKARQDYQRDRAIRGQWLGRLLKAFALFDKRPPVDEKERVGEIKAAIRQFRADPEAVRPTPAPALTSFLLFSWPSLWVLWAYVSRGGFTLPMMGIALKRRDGRKATRLQCAWRAFLVWAPVSAVLSLLVWVQVDYPDAAWLFWSIWWLAIALLAIYVVLALWFPTRSLHDRLAGTYLVPR